MNLEELALCVKLGLVKAGPDGSVTRAGRIMAGLEVEEEPGEFPLTNQGHRDWWASLPKVDTSDVEESSPELVARNRANLRHMNRSLRLVSVNGGPAPVRRSGGNDK